MIRIYLRLAIPLVAIFIALNIAARALGSTQPPNPALRGFTEGCEGKPQPCWYGIVSGITDGFTAETILRQNGYELQSKFNIGMYQLQAELISQKQCKTYLTFDSSKPRIVSSIEIDPCRKLFLGDVLIFWGFPDWMSYCPGRVVELNFYYNNGFHLHPYYTRSSSFISSLFVLDTIRLSRFDLATNDMYIAGWGGHAPSWRYARNSQLRC